MLPVLMPIQTADNSFNSNDSMMTESVNPDSIKEGSKFAEIFETASSVNKKAEKMTISENDSEGKRFAKKESMKETAKPDSMENEKLISLKKAKPSNTRKKNKSTNSRALREKLTELSLSKESGKSRKDKSSSIDIHILDEPEVSVIPDQENQGIVRGEVVKSDDKVIADNSTETIVLEQSKLSTIISSVNDGKNEKSEKSFGERTNGKPEVKKESAKKKAGISVLDLREPGSKTAKTRQTASTAAIEGDKLPADQIEFLRSDSAEDSKPIVVELNHVKDNFSGESKSLTTTTGSALMKQLEESINNKIVKQSSIILKDSDSGEIKLILKPESLGKVKIRLSLNGNRITGQITVDNRAVKDIFEQNLQNLERAFKENGFETTSLNVSVGEQHTGSGDRENSSDIAKQIEMIEEIIPTMITESANLIDLIV